MKHSLSDKEISKLADELEKLKPKSNVELASQRLSFISKYSPPIFYNEPEYFYVIEENDLNIPHPELPNKLI